MEPAQQTFLPQTRQGLQQFEFIHPSVIPFGRKEIVDYYPKPEDPHGNVKFS